MFRLVVCLATIFAGAFSTLAADAPTVPLTQAEIQALVSAEVAGAIAQLKKGEAGPIYAKLKAGFEPPAPPTAPKAEERGKP